MKTIKLLSLKTIFDKSCHLWANVNENKTMNVKKRKILIGLMIPDTTKSYVTLLVAR